MITTNKVVTVTYSLHANLPAQERKHIETAGEDKPLTFLFGAGNMIPGFERALDGLKLNDNFSFSIQPADGYGVKDDAAMVQLPIEIFKHEGAIDFEMLKTGNVLPMRDNEGNLLQGTVVSYDQEKVLMDFNHPMAGHELHFTGKVIALREAAEDEIAHGHVHDGTHHH